MGSIFRVKLFYEDLNRFLDQNNKIPIAATSLDGEPLRPGEKWETLFLVIGNESQGVQPKILNRAQRKILIPRTGHGESLNAAVATGIVLYELSN
jgi:TrmH family RNA methyltransferase